ncbi:discoidin domain-containing protein [Paenibacillus pini]|uniref:Uncharacterized protein n=1 Tax=Paenibacillus pini JCM 16418 TaxID=1236976 RepID=W7YJ89_9BACL|nr:discoidin domain-containing protein [Paenibacillus pini]GAF07663.1 hypothetical protein JCM16418_1691 [Paenibacillus pini JCM 16418]
MKNKSSYRLFKRSMAMSLVFALFVSLIPQNFIMAAPIVTIDEVNLLSHSTFEEADVPLSIAPAADESGNWFAYLDPMKVSGTAHTGNSSVKMSNAKQSLEQDVSGLQVGLTYEYSIWVKADDVSKGSLKLGVKNHGNAEVNVKATNNDWTQYAIEFTSSNGRARCYAWLESNTAGNNFYFDDAMLTVKSDLKQVSVKNGTITTLFKDSYKGTPAASDFVVTYSSSLNPQVISPLIITTSSVSNNNKTFTLNFDPLAAQTKAQVITVYVAYKGNQPITLDYPIAASGDTSVTANIKKLTATNGTLSATLNQSPSIAPVASDFSFEYQINGGEFKTLKTRDFAYNNTTLEASFSFDRLPSTTSQQTITVKAIYQGNSSLASFTISAADGMSYYVTNTGSDTNDGLTPGTAFKTIDKLNTIEFKPGDHIYFKKGEVFKGAFKPKGSGNEGHPIVVASYGEATANRPVLEPSSTNWSAPLMSAEFSMTATVNNVISFYNQAYWEVRDLELSGPNHTPDSVYRRGINITAEDAGDLNHFYFDNLVIHGFHGPDTNQGKSSGGILMEVQAKPNTPASQHIPTSINDIRITNSELYDLGRSGVNFVSVWARRAETTDTKWGPYPSNHAPGRAGYAFKPYKDFYFANNLVHDIDGDGVIVDNNKDAVVENNLVYRAAATGSYAVGFFNWNSDNTKFQYNEVYDTKRAGDGQGIEIDALNDGTLVQYNYLHDNAGGTFMWCNTSGLYGFDGIYRYNISQNDNTEHGVLDWRPGSFGGKVYNNTIYMKADGYKIFVYGDGGNSDAKFYNNIFYYPGDKPFVANKFNERNIDWKNNIFYNFANTPSNDTGVITTDPMLVDPGKGGTGVGHPLDANSLKGYKLKSGSPAMNAGITIADNGGKDYFGNPVIGIPDIGAYDSGTFSLNIGSSVYTIDQVLKKITILDSEQLTVSALLSNIVYDNGVNVKVYRGSKEIVGSEAMNTNDTLKITKDGEEKVYSISIVHDPDLLVVSSKVYSVDNAAKSIAVPQVKTTKVDDLLANLSYKKGVTVNVFHGNAEITGTQFISLGDIVKLSKGEYKVAYLITLPHDAASTVRDIPVAQYTAKAGSVEPNGGTNEGPASNVLDNNPNSLWHSLWAGDSRENLYITLTLSDKPYLVDGLRYLPRTAGGSNGIIKKYRVQYSTNGTDFINVPGGTGSWSVSGWQDVQFAPVSAKAIRLYGVDTTSLETGKLFASAAEIRLTGIEKTGNDITPPAAPTGVKIDDKSVMQDSVVVRWNAPADADIIGYKVYTNDGKTEAITYASSPEVVFARIQGLISSTAYTIRISAIDKAGNESAKSEALKYSHQG